MYCSHCGKEAQQGDRFCKHCGKPIFGTAAGSGQYQPPKKKRAGWVIAAVCAGIAALLVLSTWLVPMLDRSPEGSSLSGTKKPGKEQTTAQTSEGKQPSQDVVRPEALVRPQLLDFSSGPSAVEITPALASYSVTPGLTNVYNAERFYLSDQELAMLEENLFFVSQSYENEFYEKYEYNRYMMTPNFITVDSLLHTYHLYFGLLLSKTEKDYLAEELLRVSRAMLEASVTQYETLKGTEWEDAACRNTAFFAVGAMLQDPDTQVPNYAEALVQKELERIYAASKIEPSDLAFEAVDYTQYKPRGNYEGDEVLERYFRAMMWYGQINYTQKEEGLNRSALLMTLAMEEAALQAWEQIYTVTSFFSGVSDDLTYYEYAPAIEAAYGTMPAAADLPGNDGAYSRFVAIAAQMEPPQINSIPVPDDQSGDIAEMKKGFRFMGQRFSIDAAVMQQLVYSNVGENSSGERRMLPDVLDVPAAMGSNLALSLLQEQGASEFPGYDDNMISMRGKVNRLTERDWTSSLYSSWLYTLQPLLEEKGEGYPSFMCSDAWARKNLESFAGSYTELKHDTVLYGKQIMAEMGGGPPEQIDDRGYVEPEPELFRRFMLLAGQTAEGLDRYGMISREDKENLGRLETLADRLMVIAIKELKGELPTEEEFDLIRDYGGTLEHFWYECSKGKVDEWDLDPTNCPASLVTDIATDPNGTVLQLGNGKPAEILVVVSVEGKLRIASGMVYDFYQFEQDMDDRMTDTEWRYRIGEWYDPDNDTGRPEPVPKPWWTESYWLRR